MNSTNINKTNNHWTQKKTMIYDIGIPCPVPGLGQAFYIILILIWTVSVVQLIYSTKNYGWRNIIDFYDPFIKYLDNLNKIELMLLSQRLVQVIFCFVKKFGHWGTWNSPRHKTFVCDHVYYMMNYWCLFAVVYWTIMEPSWLYGR